MTFNHFFVVAGVYITFHAHKHQRKSSLQPENVISVESILKAVFFGRV